VVAIGGGGVGLDAGVGEDSAVIFIEGFPTPEGFAVDGKTLGDLGIGEAFEGEFDGSELPFGELADLGKVPVVPRMSHGTPGG
jgi:hypothetical protein